jgi:hypothetical protein
MALKNKLINHIDKIKEIVLENELLKYAVKSLQKKLEEKNHNIQQMKVNSNTKNSKKINQNIFQYNTPPIQQMKVNHNTKNSKKQKQWWDKQPNNDLNFKKYENDNNDNLNFKTSSQQKKIVRFNTAPTQPYQKRNIRNFVRNVQNSLEVQRQPPKQSRPKIFIILKRKKFI